MGMAVVTVSAKGQIVLPKEVRDALSISEGDTLAVYATDEVIALKPVKLPTAEEFSRWLDKVQEWAKDVGFKEQDVNDVIRSVRRRKEK